MKYLSLSDHAAGALAASAAHPRTPATGVVILAVLATLPIGWLILRGLGLAAIGLCSLAAFSLVIVARWQRGVYGLLTFLPFAGVVTLALSPWKGPVLLNPSLYKDWLFVLPAYVGFLTALALRRQRAPRPPRLPSALLIALSLLVIAQAANPGIQNPLVALIGAKVWLFYLPLYVLSFALVTSGRDLTFLLRLLVALATIPCVVGITEYVLAQAFGYQTVMDTIYGPMAAQATQGFTQFEVGSSFIERIPSTFTFVAQYSSFTLAMMVACYAMLRTDPSAPWRRLGKSVLIVVIVASLLSGSRGAFLFVPLLLGLMYGLDRGFSGLLRAGLYLAAVAAIALAVSRTIAIALYEHISELFNLYAQETAYGGLLQAIIYSPLGNGTGTNTGPARYAFERPELFTTIENYYAKAVYELGVPGLVLIWGLFAALIWHGLRSRRRLKDPSLQAASAALTAFLIAFALYSFKGWLIDLDPINVYFWVFAGLLAKLPYLDSRLAESKPGEELA